MTLQTIRRILNDDIGATAVEFAIVAPIFLLLVIGMLYTCLLLFTMGSMQYAVENGARCAAIKKTVCADVATTISYTNASYYGPVTAPVFTYSTPACGHQVSGSTDFGYDIGIKKLMVPLAASACYP